MTKRFQISYYFAKLRVETPDMDYSELATWMIENHLIDSTDNITHSAFTAIEKAWPALRGYLGEKVEEIIRSDPKAMEIVRRELG